MPRRAARFRTVSAGPPFGAILFHDVFSLAVDRYRLSARRPVAVGDTPYDIAAAHQMGLPCVALLSGGFPRASLRTAEWVCRDLPDLWQNRRELFAR